MEGKKKKSSLVEKCFEEVLGKVVKTARKVKQVVDVFRYDCGRGANEQVNYVKSPELL